MSDALNPSGPAQPDLSDAYTAPGNPATKEPAEKTQASRIANDSSATSDQRIPARQADYSAATPTSMARGVHGVDAADYQPTSTTATTTTTAATTTTGHDDGRTEDEHSQTEQMQMGAPGEGKVRDAVSARAGASGGQPGLEVDLDRKKREQAARRAEVEG